MRSTLVLLALALGALVPGAAQAQLIETTAPSRIAPRTFLGGTVLVAQPQDQFANYVEVGAGFGFQAF